MTAPGRVAIYARYSSDLQSESSIDGQVALCRSWLRREQIDADAAEILADYAVSAASLDRPAMKRLRSAPPDLLITESGDRLSRRAADAHTLVEELVYAGTRVIGVTDGLDTSQPGWELIFGVRATLNQTYLRDLGKKTKRGMETAVAKGLAACAPPYGYRTRAIENGKAIEIDEVQAAIVRRIFAEYVAGRSRAAIAERLNVEGISPPRASRRDRASAPAWQHTTIRAFLENETYRGTWIWNRREWRKPPGSNKRIARERPRSEWVIQERPELAIVDAATWEAANVRTRAAAAMFGQLAPAERRGSSARSYLLSGILRCGACRALMSIHGGGDGSRRYYRCSHASARGTCASRASVREVDAREAFLGALRDKILSPQLIASTLRRIESVIRGESGAAASERAQRLTKLSRTETKIRRLVDAIADGASDAIGSRLRDLEAEARRERIAIAELAHAATAADDVPTAEELLEEMRDLDDLLTGGDVAAGRERLRAVLADGSIVATPKGDRWILEAGVVPPILLGGTRSIRPIAGAGFPIHRAEILRLSAWAPMPRVA